MAPFLQKDIGGLDIPVDNALSMQELQYVAQFPDHLPELLLRKLRRTGGLPLYIYLDHSSRVIGDPDLVQLRQSGMRAVPEHPALDTLVSDPDSLLQNAAGNPRISSALFLHISSSFHVLFLHIPHISPVLPHTFSVLSPISGHPIPCPNRRKICSKIGNSF